MINSLIGSDNIENSNFQSLWKTYFIIEVFKSFVIHIFYKITTLNCGTQTQY